MGLRALIAEQPSASTAEGRPCRTFIGGPAVALRGGRRGGGVPGDGVPPRRRLCSQLSYLQKTDGLRRKAKQQSGCVGGYAVARHPTAPLPSVLPAPSFAVLQNPNAREIELKSASLGHKPLGRLSRRFLGEVERSPVNGQEALPANVGEGA